MSAPLTIEYDVCPDCQGSGAIPTGELEHETGMPVTRPCSSCDSGIVDAQAVLDCTVCSVKFWADQGCTHGVDDLCVECRSGCTDCADAVVEARAVSGAEAYRELLALGGAA